MLFERDEVFGLLNVGSWRQIWTWLMWMIYFAPSFSLSSRSSTIDRCDIAQVRCVQNPDCLPLLRRYLTYCSDLIDGRATSTCWPRCRRVLPLLMDQSDGRSFVTCDCQGNESCLAQQQRLNACSRGFDATEERPWRQTGKDRKREISCSVAKRNCLDDGVCLDVLSITNMVCTGVVTTRQCGKACRNSLKTMYDNDRGKRLINCRCEERKDEYSCSTLLRNAQTLCNRRKKHSLSTAHAPQTTTTTSPNRLTNAHRLISTLRDTIGNPIGNISVLNVRRTEVDRSLETDNIDRAPVVLSKTSHVTEMNDYDSSRGSIQMTSATRSNFLICWILGALMLL